MTEITQKLRNKIPAPCSIKHERRYDSPSGGKAMDRTTTTTDSLGIVTLAREAFQRGQITDDELQRITGCADDFVRILSVAAKYREVTGQALSLETIPSPTALRNYVERADFGQALRETAAINKELKAVLELAGRHLDIRALGFSAR